MSASLISIIFIVVAVGLLLFAFLGSGESSVEERLSRYTEGTTPYRTETLPRKKKPNPRRLRIIWINPFPNRIGSKAFRRIWPKPI